MCSKSNLLAPCAQQPVRHACCLPFNTAQNPAVAGVYTAPHANETKCDQSLTLELKIPLVEKKRESNKPVLERTRRERESQRQLKKMLKDLPVLQDNLCTLRFFLFFFFNKSVAFLICSSHFLPPSSSWVSEHMHALSQSRQLFSVSRGFCCCLFENSSIISLPLSVLRQNQSISRCNHCTMIFLLY